MGNLKKLGVLLDELHKYILRIHFAAAVIHKQLSALPAPSP